MLTAGCICLCLAVSGCKPFLDAFLGPAPASQASTTDASCPDVEFLGLFSIESVPGAKTYVAKIRNKAPYTKNVTIQYLDMYGQTQKAAFDVGPGAMIEGKLTTTRTMDRRPQNVRIASCY